MNRPLEISSVKKIDLKIRQRNAILRDALQGESSNVDVELKTTAYDERPLDNTVRVSDRYSWGSKA